MAFYDEPQWAVVGDTFAVGCEWGPSIVYRDTSFVDNPDGKNPQYKLVFTIGDPLNIKVLWVTYTNDLCLTCYVKYCMTF